MQAIVRGLNHKDKLLLAPGPASLHYPATAQSSHESVPYEPACLRATTGRHAGRCGVLEAKILRLPD